MQMQEAKEEFGDGVFRSEEIEVSRGYSNTLFVSVDADEQAAVQHLATQAGLSPEIAAKERSTEDRELVQRQAAQEKAGVDIR
jgi:hypothetical protein